MASDAIQRVAGDIDLLAATRRGSERNDLLPPRYEDGVAGEVGKRFSEGLATRIVRGRYVPTPAETIFVPKPGHTTRPAALLTLSDRVVYDALVEALRLRIDAAMVGPDIAYWPRGVRTDKQWRKFENGCIDSDASYVALADITAFYETIEHERLRETLTDLTGRRDVVDALVDFLSQVMRSTKGIPQGLTPSDALATAYLTPLDHAMSRECLDYHRHGDDIRIGAPTFQDAKRAIHVLEFELRKAGLLLSGSKALVMHADGYRGVLDDGDRVVEETRKALLAAKLEELRNDRQAIINLLETTGREELGWQLFYHGNMSFEEVVGQLSDHLTATDVDVAAAVFGDAMARRPGTAGALPREAFHHRVTSSIVRLAAAKSNVALPFCRDLLAVAPEKTEIVASYMMALPETDAEAVLREVTALLLDDSFRTGWEKAWLLRVLLSLNAQLTPEGRRLAHSLAESEDEPAVVRVEAMKTLAATGVCDRLLMRRLWNTASVAFRPDLVASAHFARDKQPWCAGFLDGVKDDPVNVVVLRHLEARSN